MQFVQVEGVDAFLGPHHQELICSLSTGSEVSREPWPKLGSPWLLLPACPRPTPGARVNPGDSSMDPQGAAIEDLGEAGTHLGGGEARGW